MCAQDKLLRILGAFSIAFAVQIGLGQAATGGESTDALALDALATMPVREITVFKDGHAFVLHEGEMPTTEGGNVVMDRLPAPVIGTFWPYSSDPNAKLTGVVAGRKRIQVETTALNLRELLEANIGAAALIKENGQTYPAKILGIPERTRDELAKLDPDRGEKPPEKGNVILLETHEGVKVVPVDRIQDVTFKDAPQRTRADERYRNLLTLKLDWGDRAREETARVGLVYLQKGVRWIPSYKITIDGEGKAVVKLQATLLNEMTDLEDVTAHLVIGVPTFAFKDTIDPIALQQAAAQLSQYFREADQTAFAFSNAIMTQSARMGEHRRPGGRSSSPPPPPMNLGPDMPEGARSEDLFIFTVEHVTLAKGERMVLPITEFALPYKDLYTLNVPFAPPMEVRKQFNNQQQAELAKLFAAPKVIHKIRLTNDSSYPLTTAPALIIRGNRVLAQGMMTYTAVGGTTDLEVTAAVDIQVTKDDVETERVPNAAKWRGESYDRIQLSGRIGLTNFRGEPIEVEVVRHVLGNTDIAHHDAKIEKVNVQEESWQIYGSGRPHWWGWYSWPYWWRHFNGIGRITWKLTLEPNQSVDLNYSWHYYWR